MSLIKSTATIGGYTLISRVMGFIRDITIASGIGASYLSDAFFVAFKLPNFLRRLFAEGAFNSAFVPMFSGMLAVDGKEKARDFASQAMSFLLMVLLIVTGVFILIMPWLMYLLAPGFVSDPTKFELTILLTRITMPYIIFISLVSLLGGILNSSDKFAAVAATPIIMNLCLICVPWLIEDFTPTLAHGLAIAVFVAGVAQWLWLVRFCRRQNMLPKLVRPRLLPEVKKLLLLIAPAALGAGVAQINLFIDIIIASQFESGVSYLYYADRINELPLAVIGIAVGTAILPMLSRKVREGKKDEANHSHNRAIELALFLSIPSAVGLAMVAESVIRVMYFRGAFTAFDMTETSRVLGAFAFGLPAFVMIKILAPGFFANEDTKTPFKIATFCIVLNIVLNLMLMGHFKYVGMAMATSISGWVNVVLLSVLLTRRGWLTIEPKLIKELCKVAVAVVVMLAGVYAMEDAVMPYLQEGEIIRALALIIWVCAGAAAYFTVAYALNIIGMRARIKARKR